MYRRRNCLSSNAARRRRLVRCVLGTCLALAGTPGRADEPDVKIGGFPSIDFRNLPFILIPEVGTDPNAGTTVGLMPVFLKTDEQREIRQIIAPDVIYNPYFGFGARGRIFGYPSDDTRWSVVGGADQRVERSFGATYATGLTRQGDWSWSLQAVYDVNGTGRFFGIGNSSSLANETTYVNETGYLAGRIGWNLNPAWQFAYSVLPRVVNIGAGVIKGVPSIQTVFPVQGQLGTGYDFLNMVSVTFDTRDSLDIPSRGTEVVAYAGLAPGLLGGSASTSYTVMGIDGRNYWHVADNLIVASHAAFRYMPSTPDAPFWVQSSLGGDRSFLAGAQPLRAFGAGRFIDRNLFSASIELRRKVLELDLFSTNLNVELAPFAEVGRVFHNMGDNPFSALHTAVGMGFRAYARPSVVGYVDVGYGSEGTAVFSGVSYPF